MAVEERVIQQYRDSEANLSVLNPTLLAGQEAIISSIAGSIVEGRKVGDGSTAYNDLSFSNKLTLVLSENADLSSTPYAINGNTIDVYNSSANDIEINIGSGTIVLIPLRSLILKYNQDGYKVELVEIPYGDIIDVDDILLADGTPSLATSKGALLIKGFDRSTWVPSQIELDDAFVDNPNVKWPGIRGMKGAFGEYENLIKNGNDADTWALAGTPIIEQSGNWVKVKTTVTSHYANIPGLVFTGTFNGYLTCTLKIPETVISLIVGVAGANNYLSIAKDGTSHTITPNGTCELLFANWLSGELLEVGFIPGALIASSTFTFYPDNGAAGKTAYIKDVMAVDFGSVIPTKLPYVEGIHPADNLTYYHDWGQQGTIEFWAEINFDYDVATDKQLLDNRAEGNNDNRIIFNYAQSSDRFSVIVKNTIGTDFSFLTDAFTIGTWLSKEIHHFKLNYDLSNGANFALFIDGGSDLLTTKPTLSGTFDLQKNIAIGFHSHTPGLSYWDGLIDDIRFSPTIDTSTTHYDNNVPYYNPSKLYGPNGSYSVSEDGHMSVKSLKSEEPLPGNWELIWSGQASSVANTTGAGKYRILASTFTTQFSVITFDIFLDDPSLFNTSTTHEALGAAADKLLVRYNNSGNFEVLGVGAYASPVIRRIYKAVE